MRALGIDFGERRIGLAISDPAGRIALPLCTLERKNDRGAARQIARIASTEGVRSLVLGEPLGPAGRPGEAAARIHRFAERLERTAELPVELIDETLTSAAAEERLRAAGVDLRKHPERIDAVAAQILLQEALDRRKELEDLNHELEGES